VNVTTTNLPMLGGWPPNAAGSLASKIPGERIFRNTAGHCELSEIAKATNDNGKLSVAAHRVRFK